MLTAIWNGMRFEVSPELQTPLSGLQVTYTQDISSGTDANGNQTVTDNGRDYMTLSCAITYACACGTRDVRSAIGKWGKLVGTRAPFVLGSHKIGADYFTLDSASVSDCEIEPSGTYLYAKLELSFTEYNTEIAKRKEAQNKSNTETTGTAVMGAGVSAVSKSGLVHPLPSGSWSYSSPYGYRNCPFHGYELHSGQDYAASFGTSVFAAADGTVSFSGISGSLTSGYGNLIQIQHTNGLTTYYAHLSSRLVSSGDTVKQGQVIGKVGSTGSSTGPHLHFEVRTESGATANPRNYV